jgi:hypothetical protein
MSGHRLVHLRIGYIGRLLWWNFKPYINGGEFYVPLLLRRTLLKKINRWWIIMFGVFTSSVRAQWVGSHFYTVFLFYYYFQRFPELVQQHTVERWLPIHACCINGHVHVMELLLKYTYPPHLMQKFRWVWILSRLKRHGVIVVCSLCRICKQAENRKAVQWNLSSRTPLITNKSVHEQICRKQTSRMTSGV